jgi:fucose 4-O-acetylase-like acetyltransferase
MFVCDVLVFFVIKFARNFKHKNNVIIAIIVALFVLSYGTTMLNFRLPFTIDISTMATAFVLLGYINGDKIKNCIFNKLTVIHYIVAVFALAVLLVSANMNSEFYMYINEYGNYGFALIGAISGCLVFIIFSKFIFEKTSKLNALHKYIDWLGANSLLFFPIHLELLFIIRIATGFIGINNWLINTILVGFFSVPVINFIKIHIPILTGVLPQRKTKSCENLPQ